MSGRWAREKVANVTAARVLLVTLGSLVFGLTVSSIFLLCKGISPWFAVKKIFFGSFGSWYGWKETVTKAIPLTLTGAGLALAFRGKFWNIGAEGQILFGAMAATGFGLFLAPRHPWVGIPLMFAIGALAGMLWAMPPVWLRVRFGMNEAVSSLLMNYIAAEFVQYLIYGPWKGKAQFGFPYTDDLPATLQLPLYYGSRIHLPTLVLALTAVVALHLLITRTIWGFEIRVSGESPHAAAYAGMSSTRVMVLLMIISGGLAGLAGVGEIAGIHRHLSNPAAISSGYGFTAIITAYLARLHPAMVPVSSLFFGGMLVGGDVIQTSLGLPFATIHVFNGTILLCLLAGEFFITNTLVRRPGSEEAR